MIITIDGPAGSGKSTAAHELARALGIAYLDSGAMYRAVTLKAMREGVDLDDPSALLAVARAARIDVQPTDSGARVFLDGQDVTADIRAPEVTENAHYAADDPAVREVLVALQRRIGAALGSLVTEGRDQGTVVFPQADVKLYLVASPAVRAQRRLEELQAAGQSAELVDVLRSILQRDRRDSSRPVGPLTKAPGAIEVDTSAMTIDQTAARLLACVEGRR